MGNAFEKLLGPPRHRWMKSLGNRFIVTRTGPHIQIAEPSAANELLDLALKAREHKQRVLFFCGCQWPRCNGEISLVIEVRWRNWCSEQPTAVANQSRSSSGQAGNPGKSTSK